MCCADVRCELPQEASQRQLVLFAELGGVTRQKDPLYLTERAKYSTT